MADTTHADDTLWVQRMLRIPHFGTLIGIFGGICYGSANFMEKLITDDVDPLQANACTFSLALVILSLWCIITKSPPVPAPGEYFATAIVAVMQGALLLFIVSSLSYIPAFNETVLVDTAPAFTAIVAFIWFREKISIIDCIIIAFAITGVVLVTQPTFIFHHPAHTPIASKNQLIGSVLAILGSLSMSVYACVMRKINTTSVSTLTFYSFILIVIPSIIMGFSLNVMKAVFTPSIILKYFLASIFYLLNFNLITKALLIEKAVYVIVAQVCDLPTVLILQMVILHDYPNTIAYVGALFVVVSIATIGLKDFIISKLCGTSPVESRPLVDSDIDVNNRLIDDQA